MIRVLSPGFLTTMQDLGRFGWAHFGISASGAASASPFPSTPLRTFSYESTAFTSGLASANDTRSSAREFVASARRIDTERFGYDRTILRIRFGDALGSRRYAITSCSLKFRTFDFAFSSTFATATASRLVRLSFTASPPSLMIYFVFAASFFGGFASVKPIFMSSCTASSIE